MDPVSPLIFPSQMCLACGSRLAGTVQIPHSPVISQADTNISLSERENAWTKDAIDNGEALMAQIDVDLKRAQRLIGELQRKRKEINKFVQVHQWIRSSLRRLPNEILSKIFLYTRPYISLDYREAKAKTIDIDRLILVQYMYFVRLRRAALVSSQVCRQWRNAAISTRRMWSTLSLNLITNKIEGEAQITRLWLERSDGCPLTVFMKLATISPPVSRIQEMIMARSDMWKYLDVQG